MCWMGLCIIQLRSPEPSSQHVAFGVCQECPVKPSWLACRGSASCAVPVVCLATLGKALSGSASGVQSCMCECKPEQALANGGGLAGRGEVIEVCLSRECRRSSLERICVGRACRRPRESQSYLLSCDAALSNVRPWPQPSSPCSPTSAKRCDWPLRRHPDHNVAQAVCRPLWRPRCFRTEGSSL